MSAPTCPCCVSLGTLPDEPYGDPRMVSRETVLAMCDDCIYAAFLSGGQAPHPHPMEAAR